MKNKSLNEEFRQRWKEKIAEIKKSSLSVSQAETIFLSAKYEYTLLSVRRKLSESKQETDLSLLTILTTDLKLALYIANNNYKKEFPSWFNNLKSIKFANLELEKWTKE